MWAGLSGRSHLHGVHEKWNCPAPVRGPKEALWLENACGSNIMWLRLHLPQSTGHIKTKGPKEAFCLEPCGLNFCTTGPSLHRSLHRIRVALVLAMSSTGRCPEKLTLIPRYQSYASKGIGRRGITSALCPVVICPYLCTSEGKENNLQGADCLHPVSITRFPSFRTQPLESLSVDSVTKMDS